MCIRDSFWDQKCVLLVDFLPQGLTINADVYCETLIKLRQAIQNCHRDCFQVASCFLHDNAQPHTAARTTVLLDQFRCEKLDHPPHNPDLASSDFHLFPHVKEFLGGKWLRDDELKQTVTTCAKRVLLPLILTYTSVSSYINGEGFNQIVVSIWRWDERLELSLIHI